MALSNAERQARFRARRKAASRRSEPVLLLEQAIDAAIATLWTMVTRLGDDAGRLPLEQFRARMVAAPGRDLADLMSDYLDEADDAEAAVLGRAVRLIGAVLREEEAVAR